MNRTSIEWTTFTANPIKYRDAAGNVVWACVHHSPGCQHCYAETLARRFDRGGLFNVQTIQGVTPFLDEAECRKMRTAKTIGGLPVSGSRCFIGDMTDIFGGWVDDDLLNQLFSNVLECRTDVTWQILTKRAERMQKYLSWRWGDGRIPSRHIHIGVSCENQQYADQRIPHLLQTPAAVRFVSAEPLLGPIELLLGMDDDGPQRQYGVDWVIVGGESGHVARPCDLAWVRSLVQQCKAAGVQCFVKQLGARVFDSGYIAGTYAPHDKRTPKIGDGAGGWMARGNLVLLRDRKGGDMAEWPADLRVREWPEVVR